MPPARGRAAAHPCPDRRRTRGGVARRGAGLRGARTANRRGLRLGRGARGGGHGGRHRDALAVVRQARGGRGHHAVGRAGPGRPGRSGGPAHSRVRPARQRGRHPPPSAHPYRRLSPGRRRWARHPVGRGDRSHLSHPARARLDPGRAGRLPPVYELVHPGRDRAPRGRAAVLPIRARGNLSTAGHARFLDRHARRTISRLWRPAGRSAAHRQVAAGARIASARWPEPPSAFPAATHTGRCTTWVASTTCSQAAERWTARAC